MFVSVLVTLTLLTLFNIRDVNRFLTCLFVLLVTSLSYQLYYLDTYYALEGLLGYYGFQSLPPILSIIILILVYGRLSTCLMALYAANILLNVMFFWLEGIGLPVDNAYLICGFVTYAVQCALGFPAKACLRTLPYSSTAPSYTRSVSFSLYIRAHCTA